MPHVSSLRLSRRSATAGPQRLARLAVLLGAASLWSVGCASSEKDGASADTGAAATSGAPVAGAAGENGTVHLEITGGPHAGTYDAQMTSAGCSYGLAGAGSWGNQYSVDATDPKTFSSLQLVVPDAKAAAAGTPTFKMTASFGPLFGGGSTSYDIDTRADANTRRGSGRVTVDDQGKTGRVTFEGKTADGVGLKGTIDCQTVIRAG